MTFLPTPMERAYVDLCLTVCLAGVDLWWERWGWVVSAGRD